MRMLAYSKEERIKITEIYNHPALNKRNEKFESQIVNISNTLLLLKSPLKSAVKLSSAKSTAPEKFSFDKS